MIKPGVERKHVPLSTHSVITSLMVHNGFSIPARGKTAPCSLGESWRSACQATARRKQNAGQHWSFLNSLPSTQTSDLRPGSSDLPSSTQENELPRTRGRESGYSANGTVRS